MGILISVVIAFILRICGVNIFRDPEDVGSGPLISCYIFLFALFLLFYDLRLYPRSLRSLGRICQAIIEFLIADFLMENIMMDFWFPLEIEVMNSLTKLSDLIEELLQAGDWHCEAVCDALKEESTKMIASYFISTFFLIAVLHAIRAIDLRALKEGPGCFVRDIAFRLKKAFRRKLRAFGFGPKRRVKIKDHKDQKKGTGASQSAGPATPTSKRKSPYTMGECGDDDSGTSEFDMGDIDCL